MPFADERHTVTNSAYRPTCPEEFGLPAARLRTSSRHRCAKPVFAPPVGARTCDVHLREHGGPNSLYAVLFRDCLRADAAARDAWGAFKRRLAVNVPDLLDFGQIKAPANEVLMAAAERWATQTGWAVL